MTFTPWIYAAVGAVAALFFRALMVEYKRQTVLAAVKDHREAVAERAASGDADSWMALVPESTPGSGGSSSEESAPPLS